MVAIDPMTCMTMMNPMAIIEMIADAR